MPDESSYMVAGVALAGVGLTLSPLILGMGRNRNSVFLGVRTMNGVKHHGAVFRVRWTFRLARPVVIAAFGASVAAVALTTGPAPGEDAIMFVVGLGLVLCSPIPLLGDLGFRGIVLTPDLVVVRTSMYLAALRLPWSELDEVSADEPSHDKGKGVPLIVLTILDASHLRVRWWPRFKYRYFGVRDAKTTVYAGRFGVDPALLLHALRHYLAFPGDRPELASEKAIDRIKAGKLHGGDARYLRPGARRR